MADIQFKNKAQRKNGARRKNVSYPPTSPPLPNQFTQTEDKKPKLSEAETIQETDWSSVPLKGHSFAPTQT